MVRRTAVSAFLMLTFLLLVVPASAFAGGSPLPVDATKASSHVFVDVVPNIALTTMAADIDLGDIQLGWFTGTIPFQVHANTEQVDIWAVTSMLYKGDIFHVNLDSLEVPPIFLAPQTEAGIYPEQASPVGGEDNLAPYRGIEWIDGFRGYFTLPIRFESAQNNRFSQLVDLVITWNQDDPEKPMGEYSGKVKLHARIVLP